jgi:TatD DNase family protein
MLVDSHCHLDFPDFVEDRDAVVARAREAGVAVLVTICTRISRLAETIGIVERYPGVFCAVGIHPHQVAEEGVPTVEQLVEIARHPKVVGIGETGLDYHYDYSPRPQQQESFRVHIEAARRTGLPFIVHTRAADEDTATILREACSAGPVTGLLHCFSSGRELAETALDLGLYVSASGIATFRNSEDVRAILKDVPADRLLVETDAPFLAPVPKRGKRNEPAFVRHTADALAGLKELSPAEFARQSSANFFRLFRKVPEPGAA